MACSVFKTPLWHTEYLAWYQPPWIVPVGTLSINWPIFGHFILMFSPIYIRPREHRLSSLDTTCLALKLFFHIDWWLTNIKHLPNLSLLAVISVVSHRFLSGEERCVTTKVTAAKETYLWLFYFKSFLMLTCLFILVFSLFDIDNCHYCWFGSRRCTGLLCRRVY